MDSKLVLFLLAAFCINGLNSKSTNHHAKKSKFSNVLSKEIDSSSSIANGQNGPYCQSIVAYYAGTLKNKKEPTKTFDVEFQVRLWIEQEMQKIRVQANRWNEDYSNSGNFELDLYDGEKREWCDIYDDDTCSLPLAKRETTFTLDLNTMYGNYFHLLNFNYFNNSFGLNNAVGQCTTRQLNSGDHTPDSTQLQYCVCCGDYKPDESLACPNDKWKDETTEAPVTLPPIKSLECKSLVGYYNGIFKNFFKPEDPISVEFQTHIRSNGAFYFQIDHWNEQKLNSSSVRLEANNYDTYARCQPMDADNCSIPYVGEKQNPLIFSLYHFDNDGSWINEFDFLDFPEFFNNKLTLKHTIGQCTKLHDQRYDTFVPDTSYYEYCLCCGSEYNPDPELGCPKNPWA